MDTLSYESFEQAVNAGFGSQRGGGRESLLLGAQMRVGGGAAVKVRVRNLSAGGLMAEYAGLVDIDDSVEVEVRGIGWVDGRVAWATDGRIGVAFTLPIDPSRVREPFRAAIDQTAFPTQKN